MREPTATEMLEALKWAERQLRALVTEDNGYGAFIRGTGVELAGFGLGMEKIRAAIAKAKADGGAPQANEP